MTPDNKHGYDSKADLFHFDSLFQQQQTLLQIISPSVSETDRLQQARRRALIIFNSIVMPQNVASIFLEKKRENEVEAKGYYEIRNGELYAEGFGTINEMFENTKKERPHLYNEEEHQAHLKAQELLISGQADMVAMPMFDTNGTRYIFTIKKEQSNGFFKASSIDISKTLGRDLTLVEGGDVVRVMGAFTQNMNCLHNNESNFPLISIKGKIEFDIELTQRAAATRVLLSQENASMQHQSVFVTQKKDKPLRAVVTVSSVPSSSKYFYSENTEPKQIFTPPKITTNFIETAVSERKPRIEDHSLPINHFRQPGHRVLPQLEIQVRSDSRIPAREALKSVTFPVQTEFIEQKPQQVAVGVMQRREAHAVQIRNKHRERQESQLAPSIINSEKPTIQAKLLEVKKSSLIHRLRLELKILTQRSKLSAKKFISEIKQTFIKENAKLTLMVRVKPEAKQNRLSQTARKASLIIIKLKIDVVEKISRFRLRLVKKREEIFLKPNLNHSRSETQMDNSRRDKTKRVLIDKLIFFRKQIEMKSKLFFSPIKNEKIKPLGNISQDTKKKETETSGLTISRKINEPVMFRVKAKIIEKATLVKVFLIKLHKRLETQAINKRVKVKEKEQEQSIVVINNLKSRDRMALAKISKERTRIFSVRLIRILIENRFSLDKALGTIIKPIMLSKNEVVVSKIDKMRVEVKNPFSGVQLKSNHEKISDKSEEKKSISASFIETRRLLPKMIKQLIYKLIRRYFAAAIEQKKTPEVKTVSTAQATQTDLLSVQERLSPVVPVMLQY